MTEIENKINDIINNIGWQTFLEASANLAIQNGEKNAEQRFEYIQIAGCLNGAAELSIFLK